MRRAPLTAFLGATPPPAPGEPRMTLTSQAARIAAVRHEDVLGRLGHALADAGKTAEDIERAAVDVVEHAANLSAAGHPMAPRELGDMLARLMTPPPPSLNAAALAALAEATIAEQGTPQNRHDRRARK